MAYEVAEKGYTKNNGIAMVYCDEFEDIEKVDTTNLSQGTMLYIITGTKKGVVYILTSKKQWIEQ